MANKQVKVRSLIIREMVFETVFPEVQSENDCQYLGLARLWSSGNSSSLGWERVTCNPAVAFLSTYQTGIPINGYTHSSLFMTSKNQNPSKYLSASGG